ncbi:sensor histidine kinase [Novispirillum itersonii]|uniref:histidine kinase n=1 Tax=Novispirillum itersonii TaxID=189 RepID=A0A7X0DKP3_NOVIT|nr:ATP-binding protein [Novispirillum itersonii]MBB6209130.1 signal transduction histidine kinase/CHASE3 domain sensor protein [Novispirillum itersonii]
MTSQPPSQPRPALPPFHSIGLRLMLALLLLLLTLAGAAAVAVQALTDTRSLLEQITTEDMATTQIANALAQDSQSLLGHSPRLALSTDSVSLMGNRAFIFDQMRQMDSLIAQLEHRGQTAHLPPLRQAQIALREKLDSSVALVGQRNETVQRITRRQQDLVALGDRLAAELSANPSEALLGWISRAQQLLPRLSALLTSPGPATAVPLESALRSGLDTLEQRYATLPMAEQERLRPLQQALRDLVEGPDSLASQRRDSQAAQMAVLASVRVSKQAADDLAAAALSVMRTIDDQVQQRRRSATVRGQTAMALLLTGGVLTTAVTLLVFAYIRSSVVGRLRQLRDMVLAAEERRPISPPQIIRDEIDDIGRAVGALVSTLAGRESTLRQSEEQLRLLVETAPFPLVVADRQTGTIAFANDRAEQILIAPCRARTRPSSPGEEEKTGHTDPADPGSFFDTILDPTERTRIRTAIADTAQANGRELRMRGKLGPFWAVLSASPVHFRGQNCVLFAVQDVDSLKAAEERLSQLVHDLERSNADLEQFAAAASHDLRDPLRMISGYLALLARRLEPHFDAECHEFIGYAQNGIRRMDALTSDLLDLARAGRSGPPGPVALTPVVTAVVTALSPLIEEAQATVVIPPDLPVVLGRETDLGRLFQNLIANALKYRSPDRPLTIRLTCTPATTPAGYWHLTLSDTGQGIPRDQQERVFLMFQRLQGRTDGEGTGIGLTLCRKIVEGHGGRLWLDSTLGEGSSFHFTLPGQPAA